MRINKTDYSKSITKEDLERKYTSGFADGAKAVCSLILEILKDQKFEILDDKNKNYEIALETINKSIKSVENRLNEYNNKKWTN